MKKVLLFVLVLISLDTFCLSISKPASGDTIMKVCDQMPVFPGGESAFMNFIRNNVNYPDSARNNDVQGRVVVYFVVNEDGHLSDFSIKKSVAWDLDAEALRVVKLMPKFKPGMDKGKPVRVSFTAPISFKLASEVSEEKTTPPPPPPPPGKAKFAVAETMPEFPGGEAELMKFVRLNLVYPPAAKRDNIQGRVMVSFTINEDGTVSDVVVKESASKDLDAEAVRIAKMLPRFKAGTQQGKKVKVTFNLPISFRL